MSSKISSCRRSAFQQLIRIWCKHYVPCLVQMSSLEVSVVCRNVTCSHNIHTSELWNQLNLQFWESGSRKCCYYLIISINSSTNRPPLLTTCILTSCYNICAPFNRKWVRALNCRSILIRTGQIFWSGPTYCFLKNCSFGSTHWAFNSASEVYLFSFFVAFGAALSLRKISI